MDDRDFFDLLYQQWSKTTLAEDSYWMPEPFDDHSGRHRIYAVSEDESRKLIASSLTEIDAEFVTAVHGCFGDLVKRLHSAVDEADRLDGEKDDLVRIHARLEMEADTHAGVVSRLESQISDRDAELEEANSYAESLSNRIKILELKEELLPHKPAFELDLSGFNLPTTVYPFGRQP